MNSNLEGNKKIQGVLTLLLVPFGSLLCAGLGFKISEDPTYLALIIFAAAIVFLLLRHFDTAILLMLTARSSISIFSDYGVASLYAIGLNFIAIAYVALKIFRKQRVQLDWFIIFYVAWVALQSLWVILLPLKALGMGPGHFSTAFKEWVRIASFPLLYLLIMQLRDRVHPERLINFLFMSLIVPLSVAGLQVFLPASVLPPLLVPLEKDFGGLETASRIAGTMGHPNGFAVFLVVFMCLTFWRTNHSKRPILWSVLFGIIGFFLVSTKSLVGLAMLGVSSVILVIPKAKPLTVVAGIFLVGFIFLLYTSSDYGQERLSGIYSTPLLNPEIDLSRAILTSWYDNNSFNWRIAQWHFLLDAWKERPILGYGLHASSYVTIFENHAHNDYVRALTEGGIVGFITFIIFWLTSLFRLIQITMRPNISNKQRDLCLALLAVLLSVFVGMITENVWYQTILHFYFFTLLAVSGWDWNSYERRT